MQTEIRVSSEIGRLRKVIVHRPDEGIARISPKVSEELLFDDIVHLPQMQKEHDVFTRILGAFLGSEHVYDTTNLLFEALEADPDTKKEMIRRICEYEELPKSVRELLESISNEELTHTLINGVYPEKDYVLFDPIPNFVFTRDIAVTVNQYVIITRAAKEARFRENFLTRFIFSAHPMFGELRRENRIINLNDIDRFPPSNRGEKVSIEGGDVMMIHPDYLLVGCSERSSGHGIRSLTRELFERQAVGNVVQINIPYERSFMHIDTVFTQINHNHMVVYKPLIVDGISSTVEVFRADGSSDHYASVRDFVLAELNPDMKFIYSGNGVSPYQEREQWTDGCNLLAIKPGIALAYDRNPKTEDAFYAAGYDILHAEDLLSALDRGKLRVEQIENTIITLPSSELSRARGGSHCMSCPLLRDDFY